MEEAEEAEGPKGPKGPKRADAQRNRARILDAAEGVFAEFGPGGSTEEVARRAGVAIGTVFRHFPTKDALFTAILKRLLARLLEEAGELGGPDGLFRFMTSVVTQASAKRAHLIDLQLPGAVGQLRDAVGSLLAQAQDAGTVSRDVELGEVMALLVSLCQGAVVGGWEERLSRRTLAVVFAGLSA
ncbi:helix-turn-helix domain-containing protein [Actinoplanes sp. NPDC023714]|uniref:helix-turn-helix domain-containing protein n=1 Tax=Actinoplanes sp. NPDC023714 TaxID=3154322 RepID=UPI00340C2974